MSAQTTDLRQQVVQQTVLEQLEDSRRLLAAGRLIQLRADLRLIKDKIAALRCKKNDLTSSLVAKELEDLAKSIIDQKGVSL